MLPPSATPLPRARFHLPQWLWAPCALYAVSAACILVGISKIILPVYDKLDVEKQMEKFYCLATLNIYEVALVSVALLLVIWRKVFDDAIALTLLIAIFLIASAIALDTVAPEYPTPAFLFGLAGAFAGSAKLLALNLFITGRFPRLLLLGISLLLAGNFMLPALFAHLNINASHLNLVEPWRLAWHGVLLAAGVLVAAATRLPTGAAGAGDIGRPFLRSAGMHWIIAVIILIGTVTHLFAITWAFNIPIALSEMLPAAGVAALVALELLRAYGYRLVAIDAALSLLPASVTALVVLLVHDPAARPVPAASLSDPAIFLAAFAAAVSLNAWRREQSSLQHVAALYIVAAVLLAGVEGTLPVASKLANLNWNIAGFTLGATLAVLAAVQKNVHVAMASVLVLTASITASPLSHGLINRSTVHWTGVASLIFGMLTQVVYMAFRGQLPAGVALTAAVALAMGVLHVFFPGIWPATKGKIVPHDLDQPIAAGVATLIYMSVVAIWTRDWKLLVPGSAPMAVAMFTPRESQGWIWVALSFFVLALGTAASIRKSQREEEVVGDVAEAGGEVMPEQT